MASGGAARGEAPGGSPVSERGIVAREITTLQAFMASLAELAGGKDNGECGGRTRKETKQRGTNWLRENDVLQG
jgi:hypothetical protein